MNAASDTRSSIFSNASNYQNSIAFEPLFTRKICFSADISTLYYTISPNDVHLYEDQLQMNINVFSFFDDESRARHPLVISRKNH